VLDRVAVEVIPVQGKAVIRSPNHHHRPQTHSHHHHRLKTHNPRHQETKEVLAVQEVIRHRHLQEVVVHLRHLVHHRDARDVHLARVAQTHQTPVRLPREEIPPTRKERYVD
jgi:hypothetical protein